MESANAVQIAAVLVVLLLVLPPVRATSTPIVVCMLVESVPDGLTCTRVPRPGYTVYPGTSVYPGLMPILPFQVRWDDSITITTSISIDTKFPMLLGLDTQVTRAVPGYPGNSKL
eukprot:22965-Rhodomonas_salina.2